MREGRGDAVLAAGRGWGPRSGDVAHTHPCAWLSLGELPPVPCLQVGRLGRLCRRDEDECIHTYIHSAAICGVASQVSYVVGDHRV